MTNAKRFLSAVLALIMALTMFSCLGVVAGARYNHGDGSNKWQNWSLPFNPNEEYGVIPYSDLSEDYGDIDDCATSAWLYIASEFYEEDPNGTFSASGKTWSLTDHYLQPGQKVYVVYYLKSNSYLGGYTWQAQVSRAMFDVNDGMSVTIDSSKKPQDGLPNSGYKTNFKLGGKADDPTQNDPDNSSRVGSINPAGIIGSNGSNPSVNARVAAQVSQYTNARMLNVPSELYNSWDIIESTCAFPSSSPASVPAFGNVSDQYLIGFEMEVRSGLADDTVGYFGIDPNTTKLNGTSAPSTWGLASGTITSTSAKPFNQAFTNATYGTRSAIGYDRFFTDDFNHTFIIGTPGSGPSNFTAKFYDGDTELTDLTISGNGDITLPAAPTAPAGKTFGGWSVGGSTYPAGGTYNLTANTDFTAVWNDAEYSLKFFDGSTEYTGLAMTAVAGTPVNLPAAQNKPGYRFDGWMLGNTKYDAGASFTATDDANFTAAWKQLYTATFIDRGTTLDTAEYAEGDTITFPAVTPREGFSYTWSPSDTTMPAANTTFNVVWAEAQSSITFVLNNGEADVVCSGVYGDSFNEPAPNKLGHSFGGWYLDNNTFQNAYTVPSGLPASPVTVYAKWNPGVYNATFVVEYNGVQTELTDLKVENVTFGSTFTLPELPQESGYTFSNWSPAGNTMDAEGKTYVTTKTANSYTVRFLRQDGSQISSTSMVYGSTITPPEGPSVSGKTFTGWTGNDTPATFIADGATGTVPAYDIDFTATYGTSKHNVNFYVDNELVYTGEAFVGSGIDAYAYQPATGRGWSGWTDLPAVMPDSDIDVHATTYVLTYTVTYYSSVSGETPKTVYQTFNGVEYGSAVPSPDGTPTKVGKAFANWTSAPASVTDNVELYAVYTDDVYSLVFKYADANDQPVTYNYGPVGYGDTISAADYPADAVLEGKTLKWMYGTQNVTNGFTVPDLENGATIEIIASYTNKGYTLSYYVGDSRRSTEELSFGDAITVADLPTETGFDFSAWVFYNEDTGAQLSAAPATMPAFNVKAVTTKTAHLYHDVWLDIDNTVLYEADVAYQAAIPSKELPVHEGMTVKWNYNGTNQPAEDLTIKAIATGSAVNYTVVIKTEKLDGTFDETSYTYEGVTGDTATISNALITKTGYHLSEDSVTSATIAGNGSTTLTGILLLNNLTITVVDESGSNDISVKYSDEVPTPVAAEKTGYSFNKWNWTRADNGQSIATKPATMPNYNLVATADYKINKYPFITVVDGVETGTTEITYGTEIAIPNAPEKTGFSFNGWFADPDCTTPFDFSQTMPAETVRAYGTFTANSYTYTLDPKGGVIENLPEGWTSADGKYSITAAYGAPVSVPNPELEGYTFLTWSPALPATIGDADQEFSAVYTKNSYKVTYYVDGEIVKEVNAAYGAALAGLTAPTVSKPGNNFTGWAYTFNGAEYTGETVPAGNVTANAVFAPATYTANFYAMAGDTQPIATVDVVYGQTGIAPACDYSRESYDFTGWSDGNTTIQAGDEFTMDAEGKTFNAVWQRQAGTCSVIGVERITDEYYKLGYAEYAVTIKAGESPIAICIEESEGQVSWFSKVDQAIGNAPDLISIEQVEQQDGMHEVWTVRLLLAASGPEDYRAYCEIDGVVEDRTKAFTFGVTYDVKEGSVKADDIKEIQITPTKVVKGDYATWTIKTSTDVMWLEFLGNWDGDDYITYFKYTTLADSPTENASVSVNGDVVTWTIRMRFTYAGTADKVIENFKVLYKTKNSTTWDTAVVKDGETYKDYSVDITVGRKAEILNDAVAGHEQYELISVTPIANNVAIGTKDQTFTIKTTNDVTKVRISYVNAETGKTKAATFQTTSTSVYSVTDAANGERTWILNFKFAAPAEDDIFTVDCRGLSWGEAQTVKVVVA